LGNVGRDEGEGNPGSMPATARFLMSRNELPTFSSLEAASTAAKG
jgi:hypothetical protein